VEGEGVEEGQGSDMKPYFLHSCLSGILLLSAFAAQGQDSSPRENAGEHQGFCPQANGKKARPPKKQGFFIGRELIKPGEVASVEMSVDEIIEQPVIIVKFSDAAAERLANLTMENLGKVMPMFLDGELILCPVIHEPLLNGAVQISGGFSAADAEQLVSNLKKYSG
jgi:preprotein translocase subunit SecD